MTGVWKGISRTNDVVIIEMRGHTKDIHFFEWMSHSPCTSQQLENDVSYATIELQHNAPIEIKGFSSFLQGSILKIQNADYWLMGFLHSCPKLGEKSQLLVMWQRKIYSDITIVTMS